MALLKIEIDGLDHFIVTENICTVSDVIVNGKKHSVMTMNCGKQITFKLKAAELAESVFENTHHMDDGENLELLN